MVTTAPVPDTGMFGKFVQVGSLNEFLY
ncbi:MAG: hypothetical protein JWR69_743, partial [Pedosphaera sp.]|nr:hypothetical protein [Pedosphaera sp.]